MLMTKFPCLQEMPPSEPVEQGDEGYWDTVGEVAGSRSPAPTVEKAAATEAQEEAPAEAGLVDIASILGAPTVMVV
jgi:hypothetical protein